MIARRHSIGLGWLATVCVVGVLSTGCSSASTTPSASPKPVSSTSSRSVATTSSTTLPSEWPKEVPTATVPPKILLRVAAATGQPTVLELNPGVYIARGVGPLGTVREYPTGFVGLCADVHTFVTNYRVPGGVSKITEVRFHARHDLTVICLFVGPKHA